MSMLSTRRRTLATLVGMLMAGTWNRARAQTTAEELPLGIKGYDPVAYFTLGASTPGQQGLEAEFDEIRYRFASPEHLELFRGDPQRYAPQFQGSCTMLVSYGSRIDADPEVWMIIDERLYLFGDAAAMENFKKDQEARLAAALANWPKVRDQWK